MNKSLPAVAILLLTSIGNLHAAAADSNSAEQQIRAALARWVEATNRGDYKTAFTVWAPDLIGWAPDGSDDSYSAEQKFAMRAAQLPKTTYALVINEVIVDGSLAVVRDTWTQTTRSGAGADKRETFRSFEVWRRQPDASWKISRWIDGPLTKGGS
jgi:ketosteroid isomerase-like protein